MGFFEFYNSGASTQPCLTFFFFFLNWILWSFFTMSPFSGFILPHYLSDFWKYLFPPACVLHMCMFPYSLTLSYLSFNISSDLDSVLPSLRRRPWPLCVTRMEASTACCQHSWVMHLLLFFFLLMPISQQPVSSVKAGTIPTFAHLFLLVPVTVPRMYVEQRDNEHDTD